MKEVVLIGYGGHGLVAADILLLSGYTIAGYCDSEEKSANPFALQYLGTEDQYFSTKRKAAAFVAIGNALLRKKVMDFLSLQKVEVVNAIHPRAVVTGRVTIGNGVFIAANATINPIVQIGDGVICNTSCSIDHECSIGNYSHICPGTVLCGNVSVGSYSFIGAGSVVKPGITVGDNIVVGAGSVVVKDILQPGVYFGNPVRFVEDYH